MLCPRPGRHRQNLAWAGVACLAGLAVMLPLHAENKPAASLPVITPPVITPGRAATPPKGDAGARRATEHSGRLDLTASTPHEMAARVDELISREHKQAAALVAPRCNDEDYLRRVSLDLIGTSPTPQQVTLFGLDPSPEKRSRVIDRLLDNPGYALNWARYWRDVIYMRATEQRARASAKTFEKWMTEQLQENARWSDITTRLVTATGDVLEEGHTALIYAHSAEPEELAAETSRIFLGIQIQCANCHDHPTDNWKRQQFHEFAAFFPRMRLRRKPEGMPNQFEIVSLQVPPGGGLARGNRNFQEVLQNPEELMRLADLNRDGKITLEEAKRGPGQGRFFARILTRADANKDGALTLDELKRVPVMERPGQGEFEYTMPNLQDPQSKGTQIDPAFFVNGAKPGTGLEDLERRQVLARYLTDPTNPWFAKAFVNRIWSQLLGEGFYMPIDDIGPDRAATFPQVLDVLSAGFTASGYDVKWLFRAILHTETYQRGIRSRDPSQPAVPFAAAVPVRLRADPLYDELIRVLGVTPPEPQRQGMGPRYFDNSPRGLFESLFGFDPSTLPDDITATVPQSLFLMNSPLVGNQTRASGGTRLAGILTKFPDNKEALTELYLLVHSREPSAKELKVCQAYLQKVPQRNEAFEDILWTLLNSTEFQTKR